MLLQQQFVKVLLRPISDIQQYRRIPYHLLLPRTAYIHRAPRHMIARRHSPRQPIHLRRPIPRINHNRLFTPHSPLLTPRIYGSRSPRVKRSPRVWPQSTVACDFTLGPDPSNHSQLLQPPANADQILNHTSRRNIPIRRHILRLTQLPKFKVRRQSTVLIHFYLFHNYTYYNNSQTPNGALERWSVGAQTIA